MLARILGILIRPRSTMVTVRDQPRSAGVLALATLLAATAGAVVFSTDIGQQALVDQWERTAFAFGRPVDDARYEQFQRLSAYGWAYGLGSALLNVPAASLAVAGFVFAVLRRPPGVRFRHVAAVAAHAAVIPAARQLVAAPLIYWRETTASATALAAWFPIFDEASPAARFLGLLDLFVIWWAIVFALGIAIVYGRPAGKVAASFVAAYVALALVLAAAMAVTGGTS